MIAYIATESTITVILDGKFRTIQVKSKAHRNDVIKALEKYKKSAQTLEDKKLLEAFLAPIKRISLASDNRFEVDESENKMYLTGTTIPLPPTLSEKIMDFLDNGLPINSLVKFWESCLKNPHFVAVEELFSFLERNHLPITDDGGFLGYKKLNLVNTSNIPDEFEELIVDSKGVVRTLDGKKVTEPTLVTKYLEFINNTNNPLMKDVHSGTIKQKLGDVVKIERVKFNEQERRNACGYGLHIGAFSYHFGGNVRVLCKVMPEDVIACNPHEQKLRTCRYQIVSFVDEAKEIKDLLVNLSKESQNIADGVDNAPKKIDNPFLPEEVIVCTKTIDNVTQGSYYFVVDIDDKEVLIIDNSGEEEWYPTSLFAKR